jgi:hypothetical protein
VTDLSEARSAAEQAKVNLAEARRQGTAVESLNRGLEGFLERNHFSVRIARLYGLEKDE